MLLKSFQKFEKLRFTVCGVLKLNCRQYRPWSDWAGSIMFVLILKLLQYFYIHTVCLNVIHSLYYNFNCYIWHLSTTNAIYCNYHNIWTVQLVFTGNHLGMHLQCPALNSNILVNWQSRHWSDCPFQDQTNMYQLELNYVPSAHEGAV